MALEPGGASPFGRAEKTVESGQELSGTSLVTVLSCRVEPTKRLGNRLRRSGRVV